jgi:hypothetical protein
LTVITLLAIGVAVAATFRGFGPAGSSAFSRDAELSPQINVALPALFCVDDLAGESVETACEKALFGSAESAAAAVSYAAGRLGRLLAFGNVAARPLQADGLPRLSVADGSRPDRCQHGRADL